MNKTIQESLARIVQYSDESKTLPDGSKIIYAENEDKIVLYHKIPFEKGNTYIYDRTKGQILLNGKEGDNADKRMMLKLGSYLLTHSKDEDLMTIHVHEKGQTV